MIFSQLKVKDATVPGLHSYESSEVDLRWYYKASGDVTSWE